MSDSEYETENLCKYPFIDLYTYTLNYMVQDFL
jgi:hypothetical protein